MIYIYMGGKLIQENKKWLRLYLGQKRQKIGRIKRRKWSEKIARQLSQTIAFKKAKTIALFLGFSSEIDTFPILKLAWKKQKKIFIPNTSRGLKNTFFSELRGGDKLRPGQYGPLESQNGPQLKIWNKIDLVLVPGLGFDLKGNRIGFGGGVYDRILKKTPRAHHLGLFFSIQQLHQLPTERFDQKLDSVLTELGHFTVSK